jgi:hypothetical protein
MLAHHGRQGTARELRARGLELGRRRRASVVDEVQEIRRIDEARIGIVGKSGFLFAT